MAVKRSPSRPALLASVIELTAGLWHGRLESPHARLRRIAGEPAPPPSVPSGRTTDRTFKGAPLQANRCNQRNGNGPNRTAFKPPEPLARLLSIISRPGFRTKTGEALGRR